MGTGGYDDSNHNDDIIAMPGERNSHDVDEEEQSFNQSAMKCTSTNPDLLTLVEHRDTEKKREDHVIASSNGSTNALELLMGQYHDTSDSELEPGEIS